LLTFTTRSKSLWPSGIQNNLSRRSRCSRRPLLGQGEVKNPAARVTQSAPPSDRRAAYIALVGAFSGLPPLSVQTLAEVAVTQPLPLHEFWPMQPLLALLHELWPLQLLPPTHFTLPPVAEFPEELCAKTGVVRNIAPTAAAKTAPVIVLRSIVVILLSDLAESRPRRPSIKYAHPPGARFGSANRVIASFAASVIKSRGAGHGSLFKRDPCASSAIGSFDRAQERRKPS
jgi:hypothetical protein